MMRLNNPEIYQVEDTEDFIIRGFNPETGVDEAYQIKGLRQIASQHVDLEPTPINPTSFTIDFSGA